MGKKITSYSAPFFGVCTLIFSDFTVIIMNLPLSNSSISFIVLYNILVFLALWSLFSAMWCDPGFIPRDSVYDLSKMSRLTAALYKNVSKYQDIKIDITKAGGDF
jgi:hypothetical protein